MHSLSDTSKWTWGYELEVGDVDRTVTIPPELGKWEYFENEVLNLREPYALIACDPLGKNPPVGGEINVYPSKSRLELVERIGKIFDLFPEPPTTTCMQGGHVHIHIPGLTDSGLALNRIHKYFYDYQQEMNTILHGYTASKEISSCGASTKMQNPIRKIPEWLHKNRYTCSYDHASFQHYRLRGMDGIGEFRAKRYCVNFNNLLYTKTIEFRAPRATVDLEVIRDTTHFLELCTLSALENGYTPMEIFSSRNFKIEKFKFDSTHYLAWVETKRERPEGSSPREYKVAR